MSLPIGFKMNQDIHLAADDIAKYLDTDQKIQLYALVEHIECCKKLHQQGNQLNRLNHDERF